MVRTNKKSFRNGSANRQCHPSFGSGDAIDENAAAEAFNKKVSSVKKKKRKLTFLERVAECDISEEVKTSVALALKKFETTEDQKELEFPSSLTSEERKYLHLIAQQMGLKSKSRGPQNDRIIVISRRDPSTIPVKQKSWKKRALKYGGVEELLKQKEERRRIRAMELENDRLLQLEKEKRRSYGFYSDDDNDDSHCATVKIEAGANLTVSYAELRNRILQLESRCGYEQSLLPEDGYLSEFRRNNPDIQNTQEDDEYDRRRDSYFFSAGTYGQRNDRVGPKRNYNTERNQNKRPRPYDNYNEACNGKRYRSDDYCSQATNNGYNPRNSYSYDSDRGSLYAAHDLPIKQEPAGDIPVTQLPVNTSVPSSGYDSTNVALRPTLNNITGSPPDNSYSRGYSSDASIDGSLHIRNGYSTVNGYSNNSNRVSQSYDIPIKQEPAGYEPGNTSVPPPAVPSSGYDTANVPFHSSLNSMTASPPDKSSSSGYSSGTRNDSDLDMDDTAIPTSEIPDTLMDTSEIKVEQDKMWDDNDKTIFSYMNPPADDRSDSPQITCEVRHTVHEPDRPVSYTTLTEDCYSLSYTPGYGYSSVSNANKMNSTAYPQNASGSTAVCKKFNANNGYREIPDSSVEV